jgi:hypothetical protein
MPLVLTISSQIACAHQAPVSLSSDAKLLVMGARVLVLPEVVGAQIVGCTNPDSSSSKKCLTVATASGTATKLTVAGQLVVNDTFAGTSDGTTSGAPVPLPLTLVNAGQTKLSAV